jgi:glycosyltransferase involved in cell wall biosynthesis
VPVRYELIARGDQLPYVEDLPGARVRTQVDDAEFLRLYQQADLFVLPLPDVVASNTLLEALACGAPTVVTDVGAVRDYVDEECVAFARPQDPESLANAMEQCLTDGAYARQVSARGRARAETLDVGLVAGLHRDLYQSLQQPLHVQPARWIGAPASETVTHS